MPFLRHSRRDAGPKLARFTDNLVVVTDADGKVEWVNEAFARAAGFSLEEMFGKSPGSMLQGPETDPEVVQEMREAVVRQEGFDVEVLNYSKSGRPYWVSIESRPIRDDAGEVINFIAIESDITLRRRVEEEKQELSRELIELSRQAGKAEVATGVLHNVGNVLNSINVSANVMSNIWRDSRLGRLNQVVEIVEQHRNSLPEFVETKQGKLLPNMLRGLSDALAKERDLHHEELTALSKCIEHVKEIVRSQQQNARASSAYEAISPPQLVDEAIRYDQAKLDVHGVGIQRDYTPTAELFLDRHRALQILVNLIRNARNAVVEYGCDDPQIELSIRPGSDQTILIAVKDNGMGIESQNLTRIFTHGFTTRAEGHGFGLHASALAAQSLGGLYKRRARGQVVVRPLCCNCP